MDVAPISTKNQVALSRVHRSGDLSRATRQVVPPFLQKLYEMISNPDTDHLIRWSETGDSFFVLDPERFAHDILPHWFKHNKFNSFVRQLNMYGFHKIPHPQQGALRTSSETEFWNFEHPSFQRGQPDLLCLITRKRQAERDDALQPQARDTSLASGPVNTNPNAVMDINAIINGIAAIKRHQTTISADLNDLKSANQHLWQEALAARERHKQHQDTIDRIIKFLGGVFGNVFSPPKGQQNGSSSHPVFPRNKRPRLMIEQGNHMKSPNPEPLISQLEEVSDDDDDFDMHSGHLSTVEPSLASGVPSPSLTVPVTAPSPATTIQSTVTPEPPNDNSHQQKTIDPSLASNSLSSSDQQYPTTSNLNESFLDAPTSASSSANQVATSLQNNPENVLQALLNSPTQLQRLLATFAVQQNMPLSGPPESSPSAFNPYPSPTFPSFNQPTNPPIDSNAFLRPSESTSQPLALTFQGNHDISSLAPLVDTSSQLQKTHRDAETISADVESLQASIDTLLENLGLDPESVKDLSDTHHIEDPVLTAPMSGLESAKPDPVINYQPPPQEFDIDKFLSEWGNRQTNGDTSSQPDGGGIQSSSTIDDHNINLLDPSNHLGLGGTSINNGVVQPSTSSLTSANSIAGNNTMEEDVNPKRGRKRKSQAMEISDEHVVMPGRKGLTERKK